MEPMVAFALGIVAYCGYLTVKDIVTDLRDEGFTGRSLFSKCLECRFGDIFWRLFATRSWPHTWVFKNTSI